MRNAVAFHPCAQRAVFVSRARTNVLLSNRPILRNGCRPIGAGREDKVPLVASIDDEATNVTGDFCSIDEKGKKQKKRTVGEMEQEFLEAMSAWYFDKKALLTDSEFENLREELLWSGSKIAVLDKDEQKFLEASMAYARGKPIMSDDEYDELKSTLKNTASIVTAQGPRCSIRSKKMYSDASTDVLRMTALNLPAVLLVLGVVFAIDDFTGFEITTLLELPPPYGVLVLWGLLLPVVFVVATTLTNIGFKDGLILKGPCPSCGTENYTYFGDLFTVRGNRGTNVVECPTCTASLTFDQNKRMVIVDETSEEKQKQAAAAAAKKAAAAAKKKQRAAAADN